LAHVRQPTVTPLPNFVAITKAKQSDPPKWVYRWIAAGLLFFAFIAGIFILLELDKEQLTIES